ncbi:hypothetical protein LZ32DRAFT_651385 [Colletotrichum eremochloae]|nr:hypothetical protein LZ32DRAFT_651385 [Colletotrichum eremochloae]
MNRNHGDATTSMPPPLPKSSPHTAPRKAARVYPALSLLSITLLFLSSAAGIVLSAIILFRNLESTEVLDPLSRAVFFIASCVSLVYVFTHVIAARIAYIKSLGSHTAYEKYVAGFAFLLARLGLPVWIAAITLAIFVAVNVGLDLAKGVKQNIPWLNVIISIASILSLIAVLVVIEMADRPFATLGFSQTWFIRADDASAYYRDDDLRPRTVEAAGSFCEKREEHYGRNDFPEKQERMKRKTLTKRNTQEPQQRVLRHARSMSMPTPLNTVFSDASGILTPDSPAMQSSFAWRPPTSAGSTRKAEGTEPIHGWVTWQEHSNIRQAASDISTNASARPNEVILPYLRNNMQYSPRSQYLLEQKPEYDPRRWTAIGVQSPPSNGGFPVASFQRPLTPLMTMEEENKIMSRGSMSPDGDWQINQHSRGMQGNRPASSRATTTTTTSITPRVNSTTEIAHVAPLPYMATVSERLASPSRPDSDVLPNEGSPRGRISINEVNEVGHLEYRAERQRDSYHTSRLSTRPPSQYHPSWDTHAPAQRPVSPTPSMESVRSTVYNFSRPRTSSAARMQIKVARRLRYMKQHDSRLSAQRLANEQMPTPPSTPGSPDMPRTVRAATMEDPEDKIGRTQMEILEAVYRRSPSPETPRTARATAVKNLQERLGRRMLRHDGAEARQNSPV